jgi:ELWxxDGT repeat protein
MRRALTLAAILVLAWYVLPVASGSALERSAPAVVKLADGSPYFLGSMNGELYYAFDAHLWKTDGSPAGTIMLSTGAPLGPHHESGGCLPLCPAHYPTGAAAGGLFFFAADDGVHGMQLWTSNGSPGGTGMVASIDLTPFDPTGFIGVDDVVFFMRHNACPTPCELWRSNGTVPGTFLLTTMPGGLLAANINGALLFQKGADLWKSNGTLVGTAPFMAGAEFGIASDGLLFFTVSGDLWVTDGTPGGTAALTAFPVALHACVNAACYFSESTSTGLEGIWRTDGTPGGTVKLTPLVISPGFRQFVDVNGIVYFTNGDQLWKTNGTPLGTALVTTVAMPLQLTSAYGALFFLSSGELWRSDGTAAGTGVVTTFGQGETVGGLVVLHGRLMVRVDGPLCQEFQCVQDWHLYRSDGSAAGTQVVADLARNLVNCPTPICAGSILSPVNSSIIQEKWFFEALDSVAHAPKLWMATYVFFEDVLPDHWAFASVERLATAGITGGCSPQRYCPDDAVTRAQMAVFLERGLHGPAFDPPAGGGIFSDVPLTFWAVEWIEQLYADGVTSGCGTGPLVYCPETPVTRAEMAVFLLRARHGPSYTPPPVGTATGFADVPTTHWAAAWIRELATEGITGGCAAGLYCPEDPVTRAQMAVFLVRTFGIP